MVEQSVRVRRQPEEVVVLTDVLDRALVDRAEVPLEEVGLVVIGLAVDAVETLVVAEVDVVASIVLDRPEDLDHRVAMARLRGPDVVVVGDVEPRPHLPPLRLELVHPCLGSDAVGLGRALHLEPVFVGASEVKDILTAKAVPTRDEVGADGVVGVPDMRHVVGVVDRRRDVEDVASHGAGHRTGSSRGARCASYGAMATCGRQPWSAPTISRPRRSPGPYPSIGAGMTSVATWVLNISSVGSSTCPRPRR